MLIQQIEDDPEQPPPPETGVPELQVEEEFTQAILAAGYPEDAMEMVAFLTDNVEEALNMLPV